MKGDVSIRDSLKKNVSQRGLGSHRPHGTRAGLTSGMIHSDKELLCSGQLESRKLCRVTSRPYFRNLGFSGTEDAHIFCIGLHIFKTTGRFNRVTRFTKLYRS